MRILGSLRSIPGALWTREGVAVETPPAAAGGTQANRFRRTVSPPLELVRVAGTAYPDGVLLRLALGRADADGTAAADAVGFALDAEVGAASAAGASAAAPVGIEQRVVLGDATAFAPDVAVKRQVARQTIVSVVYVPVPPRRKDAVDRAWDDLQAQREEDLLLDLLGVFE